MDALLIHPSAEGRGSRLTLLPLIDVASLAGRMNRAGWAVEIEDGSFLGHADFEARLRARPKSRVAWVHALRGEGSGALPILRALKEEGWVVGAFGRGARRDPVPLLRAGADVVAGSVEAAAGVTSRLSVQPWEHGPARMPSAAALLEVPGVTILDHAAEPLRSTALELQGWRTGWLPDYAELDLDLHLERTAARVGRPVMPYRCASVGSPTAAAGARVAEACVQLWRRTPGAELRFIDPDLARGRVFILGLARELRRQALEAGVEPHWTARVGAQRVDQPMLEVLVAGGCRGLCTRAEVTATSASEPMLVDVRRVVDSARRLGLEVTVELGVGRPSETSDELEVALRRLGELGPGRARVAWEGPRQLSNAETWLISRGLEAIRSGATGPARRTLIQLWRQLRAQAGGVTARGRLRPA